MAGAADTQAATTGRETISWDLSGLKMPEIDSESYLAMVNDIRARMTALGQGLPAPDGEAGQAWVAVLEDLESLQLDVDHLRSFILCLYTEDTEDAAVCRQYQESLQIAAQLEDLSSTVEAALGRMPAEQFNRLLETTELRSAAAYLRDLYPQAASDGEQAHAPAAAVREPALYAWTKLYQQVSSSITFEYPDAEGRLNRLPIAKRRSLYGSKDRDVRDSAFVNVKKAWMEQAPVLATTLNAISQSRLLFTPGRDGKGVLAGSLNHNRMRHATLESMFQAVAGFRDVMGEYLSIKARALGKEKIGFQDLSVLPFGEGEKITLDTAKGSVERAFGRVSPRMAQSVRDIFAKNWIKVAGGSQQMGGDYCMPFPKVGQCRLYIQFNGGLLDCNTLAHELGHAYHTTLLSGERFWKQMLPTSLAETASNVAEALFRRQMMKEAESPALRARILGLELDKAVIYLLYTAYFFQFESRLYEERMHSALDQDQLSALLVDCQIEWFGQALDEDYLEPHGWMSNHLLYDAERCYYNYPYTFGYLLSRLLVGCMDNPGFCKSYEAFLRESGSGSVEDLCSGLLAMDLNDSTVWQLALAQIKADVDTLKDALRERDKIK